MDKISDVNVDSMRLLRNAELGLTDAINLRDIRFRSEAPPLVCANCGKDPSEHNVTAAPERLVCGDKSGREWKYTDVRRAWDILRQLDELDVRSERLRSELFLLMEPHL